VGCILFHKIETIYRNKIIFNFDFSPYNLPFDQTKSLQGSSQPTYHNNINNTSHQVSAYIAHRVLITLQSEILQAAHRAHTPHFTLFCSKALCIHNNNSIRFNSIQFNRYLLMCRLNSESAYNNNNNNNNNFIA
jgi:hypothetical protein